MLPQYFTGVGKLIEALKEKDVIKETDKQLNILFDNWCESTVYKSNWWVEILTFSIIGETTRSLSFKEFHDIMPDVKYLNIGKQVSASMRKLPWTKGVHRLFIGLNKVDNGSYSYYPMKLDSTSDFSKQYSKLKKARSKTYFDKCNEIAEKIFDEGEECFDECDDDYV